MALTKSKAGFSSGCINRSSSSVRTVYKGLSVAWVCSREKGAGRLNLSWEDSLALVV